MAEYKLQKTFRGGRKKFAIHFYQRIESYGLDWSKQFNLHLVTSPNQNQHKEQKKKNLPVRFQITLKVTFD